ncbi:MAG: hypothetical protein M4D80_04270 [Myxococcota bacterium]|nr:hypothetical protein [Deltaproteobacteria bacterium]MDQ3334354.1 hypothetical protein [Myxococcota bacterium]
MRRFLLILLLASPAFADTGTHKEGEYGGVIPGQKPDTATAKPKRPPPKGTLAWIGFEAKDGGAQLFFQSVGAFQVSQKVVGSTVVATLDLTKLASNTWRKIDTRFFDNPLAGVVAKALRGRKGRGIEVRISFKNPKDAREGSLRTATEADGMYYAYLSFPEGTATASDPSTKTEAKTDAKDVEK